jgi:hypothetical protein
VSTLKELENEWALKMAAVYKEGPRAGQRPMDCDPAYARDVTNLRVQIEELKAAEAARPQINHDQLTWLNRLRATPGGNGPLLFEMSEKGTKFRANVNAAAERVARGEDISALIANTEADLSKRNIALPAPAIDQSAIVRQRAANHIGLHLPPSGATQLGGGAIITNVGPKS